MHFFTHKTAYSSFALKIRTNTFFCQKDYPTLIQIIQWQPLLFTQRLLLRASYSVQLSKNKVSVFHAINEGFGFTTTRMINHCSLDTDWHRGLEGNHSLLVVLYDRTSACTCTLLHLLAVRKRFFVKMDLGCWKWARLAVFQSAALRASLESRTRRELYIYSDTKWLKVGIAVWTFTRPSLYILLRVKKEKKSNSFY